MSDQPRVYMSLFIETDQAPEDVQLSVLASISDRYKVVSNSVQGFNGDDDPMPDIQLVVCPVRGLLGAFVNDEQGADALAKAEGAVWVGWSADADHRGEVTA